MILLLFCRNHALRNLPEEMVLLTLRYYATGNFLQTLGDLIGVDKGTASRCVWKITTAIAGLYNQYIKMPTSQGEINDVSQR